MMTRRENINQILMNRFETLKESVGYENFKALALEVTNEIMDLSRPKEEIIHCIGPNGQHRLIIDGKSTSWKQPSELARNGSYIAATDYYIGQVPQLALIKEIDTKEFMVHSQQNLAMTEIAFVKPD